jgi:hypothetical protein
MSAVVRCLLVYPEFTSESFWNYRATCKIAGAAYPAPPLGMITVAAMLPENWECQLIDCNVEALEDEVLEWSDLVLTGGMIAQQRSCLALIDRVKAIGKTVVVGGPDATSSPHVYGRADHLVLGEGEVTIPRWLTDLEKGTPQRIYAAGQERATVTSSPLPRFDLLHFDRYLHVGIQFARGCPFRCEFCDIIELFGRVPRLKDAHQILAELQCLYDLGYRGHIDFVDDNFIGNRRDLKMFLPELKRWLEQHGWPFEFSTEASINLAGDEELLEMMQDVGFAAIFVGIESPDEETLRSIHKGQNTRRELAASVRKIYSYGIFVNTGYIVGFDQERGSVAAGVLELIEASSVPVNMVGLLCALPNTQLSRRLAREARLSDDFDVVSEGTGDQCTGGLNFITIRPRADILRDYYIIIDKSYAPQSYFARVRRVGALLNCRERKLRLPLRSVIKDLGSFCRLIGNMGIRQPYRAEFWKTLLYIAAWNPKALRYSIALMALYLHFGEFRTYLLGVIERNIDAENARAGRKRSVAEFEAAG